MASRTVPDALEIDRDLLVNQREVFEVLQDTILRLRPVEVVKFNRTTVVITQVPAGTPLLAEPVTGAFDGMKVKALPAADPAGSQSAPQASEEAGLSSLNQ